MKEILVLEQWTIPFFILRLVTDGENLWVEYKNTFAGTPKFWRKDDSAVEWDDETFNHIVPVFS